MGINDSKLTVARRNILIANITFGTKLTLLSTGVKKSVTKAFSLHSTFISKGLAHVITNETYLIDIRIRRNIRDIYCLTFSKFETLPERSMSIQHIYTVIFNTELAECGSETTTHTTSLSKYYESRSRDKKSQKEPRSCTLKETFSRAFGNNPFSVAQKHKNQTKYRRLIYLCLFLHPISARQHTRRYKRRKEG